MRLLFHDCLRRVASSAPALIANFDNKNSGHRTPIGHARWSTAVFNFGQSTKSGSHAGKMVGDAENTLFYIIRGPLQWLTRPLNENELHLFGYNFTQLGRVVERYSFMVQRLLYIVWKTKLSKNDQVF